MVVLGRFLVYFPTVIFAWIKICTCACLGTILEDPKDFKLLLILNVHILRIEVGCFTVTLTPKLKTLFFYRSKFQYWRSYNYDATNHQTTNPSILRLQKWTIDLLLKNNGIYNHVTDFKTSPSPVCVDATNVCFLIGKNF